MSDIKARQLYQQFRGDSSAGGAKITFGELREVFGELQKADGPKPADQFSPAARELLAEIDKLDSSNKGAWVGWAASYLSSRAESSPWTPPAPPTSTVLEIPSKNNYDVFLTPSNGFAVNAAADAPTTVQELGNALYSAGEWVQASFGSGKNLFSQPGFDHAGRLAVISQFRETASGDLSNLSRPERNQVLGNIAGLLVELIKSAGIDVRTPVADPSAREMVNEAFKLLTEVLNQSDLSALVRRQLVAYLADDSAETFRSQLTRPQRAEVAAIHESLNPKAPFDYDKWDAQGKDTIVVKHLAGSGEGFLYGFGKWLQEEGIGAAQRRPGQLKAEIVSGTWDDDRGPVTFKIVVPKDSPYNKWGREMTVQLEVSDFRNNMFDGLGDQNVDITGYDGHSGFGRNTLRSLPSAPAQQVGDKLFYRFVCAGVDAENAIAHQFPEAYVNSYTTQDSGYFWKRPRPGGGPEYAYRSEGWVALGNMILGVLGKEDHAAIQADMKTYANMASHSPGNDNNFVGPGDPRRGGSADYDGDGVANMYDVMPTVNTFDVAADAAKEFAMALPDTPANKIKGGRAFQAVQFVDTATNYTPLLKKLNLNRKMQISPNGPFFDGADAPKTYVRIQKQGDDVFVQFNSALSAMTMESLRAVLYFETSKALLGDGDGSPEAKAENVAAALMFAASSLEYDMGWRDEPVFAGLKAIYNIPDDVDYASFRSALRSAEGRHNYSGDSAALRDIMAQHGASLAAPGVGQPAMATR